MVSEQSKKNLAKGKPFRKGESAPREAQKKSAKKRKENRTFRQIVEDEFKYRGSKEKGIQALIAKFEGGDLAAFDRLRDLLNEKGDENRAKMPSLSLTVSESTAEILKQITEE